MLCVVVVNILYNNTNKQYIIINNYKFGDELSSLHFHSTINLRHLKSTCG